MRSKRVPLISGVPCVVCNPDEAQPGEYCKLHGDQLRHLDSQYETLFRIKRTARGKDHETYNFFLQGDSHPCGRILVTETDPENLFVTVLISRDIDLEVGITEYEALKITRTFGDQLRERIRQDIIYSWYGNARACIELFQAALDKAQHWDIEPRLDHAMTVDEEIPEPRPPRGGKNSIH
jgi:hypothetical protein